MKKSNIIKISIAVVTVAVIVAIYFLTPLSEYMKIDKMTELTKEVPKSFNTALAFLGIFFIGGSLFIPIPLIAFAVSLVFGIWVAVAISIPGFFLASLSGYFIGKLINGDSLGDNIKKHLDNVKEKVDDKGPWAILALRLAPTPPFTLTSIIGGSLDFNIFRYTIGSTIGIAPLALSAIFFGKGALKMMKEPSGLAASSLVAAIILYIIYRIIKKKQLEDN